MAGVDSGRVGRDRIQVPDCVLIVVPLILHDDPQALPERDVRGPDERRGVPLLTESLVGQGGQEVANHRDPCGADLEHLLVRRRGVEIDHSPACSRHPENGTPIGW